MGFKIIIQVASRQPRITCLAFSLYAYTHREIFSFVSSVCWVCFHAWLWDVRVLKIIVVTLSVFVPLRNVVVERWKVCRCCTSLLWPLPSVVHWGLEIFKNREALIHKGRCVGILMAHLHDNSTVDVFLVVQVVITFLEGVKSVGSSFKSLCVILNLSLVVVNIACIFFNIRLVLVTEGLGVLNSVLQVCSGESEGLSSDKHIGGLGNLELVVLSSKESVSVLEA